MEPKDYKKLDFNQLKELVNSGDSTALLYLGICYEKGSGVEVNINAAIECFEHAQSKGIDTSIQLTRLFKKYQDPTFLFLVGNYFYEKKEYDLAFKYYSLGKDNGSYNCFPALGLMYYYGYAVKQNYKKAFSLLKIGDWCIPEATYCLGLSYKNGLGVEKDEELGEEYIQKALAKGYKPVAEEAKPIIKQIESSGSETIIEVTTPSSEEPVIIIKDDPVDKIRHLKPNKETKKPEEKPALKKPEIVKFIVDYEDCSLEELEKEYEDNNYYACSYLGDKYYAKNEYQKAHKAYLDGYTHLKDSKCALGLGLIYLYHLKEPNYEKAFEYFGKSKEAAATYYKGICYENGYGVHQNRAAAATCYRLAANLNYKLAKQRLDELGLPLAPREDRIIFYESLSNAELLKLYKSGDYKSYPEMGRRFYQQDEFDKAIEAFRKGIQANGHAYCAYKLGWMYYYGEHLERDYVAAFNLLMLSAQKGYGEAYYFVGLCYYNGYGAKQNYYESFKWFSKAAKDGDIDALSLLGDQYYYGYGVEQDYEKAVEYFRKAAENDNAYSQYSLGYCYEHGEGVYADIATAVYWYRKAAKQGQKSAIERLRKLGYSY